MESKLLHAPTASEFIHAMRRFCLFVFVLPRIKCFPVNKRGVVVVADVISSFGLPDAQLGDEVSVHDDISEHRAGVALHGRPRSEEEKGKAAGKHPGGAITSSKPFLFYFMQGISNDGDDLYFFFQPRCSDVRELCA